MHRWVGIFVSVFAVLLLAAEIAGAADPIRYELARRRMIVDDFWRHLDQIEAEERRRLAGANAHRREREKQDGIAERQRREFVRKRVILNDREQERLDRLHEAELEKALRARTALELQYVRDRNRLEQALRGSPRIDERLEWGL